jgi:hypothetical protein
LSIIKHVTLQKIVAHDFQYDTRRFAAVEDLDAEVEVNSAWEIT